MTETYHRREVGSNVVGGGQRPRHIIAENWTVGPQQDFRFVRTTTPRRPTSQKSPISAPHARLHCRYGVQFHKPTALGVGMSRRAMVIERAEREGKNEKIRFYASINDFSVKKLAHSKYLLYFCTCKWCRPFSPWRFFPEGTT